MVRERNQQESADETANGRLPRRRVLQSSATAIGGLGVATTASADEGTEPTEPCEQLVPDLAIRNRDDQVRTIAFAMDRGQESETQEYRTIRVEAGGRQTVDILSPSFEGHRARATVDEVDEDEVVVQELDELLPERFRHGLRITIESGRSHVETQHVDMPPREHREMIARCDE